MAGYFISAHAQTVANRAKTKVPAGCTMYFYGKMDEELPHDTAFKIFDELAKNNAPGGKVVHTIFEDGEVTDYAVWHLSEYSAYSGVFTLETNKTAVDISGYTEKNPIYLSEIFAKLASPTAVYWLACR